MNFVHKHFCAPSRFWAQCVMFNTCMRGLTHSSPFNRPLCSVITWRFQDIFRPAANLADRMRGRMEYVNKKIKIIRSRSAERLRGYIRPEVLQVGGGEDKRSQQVSDRHHLYQYRPDSSLLPVLGKARALVSCTPSPYDIDIQTDRRTDRHTDRLTDGLTD